MWMETFKKFLRISCSFRIDLAFITPFCSCSHHSDCHKHAEKSKKFDVRSALRETLQLMKSVYPYLILGSAIGAIIHGLVPTNWIASAFGSDNWWVVPIAAIVGIPLYIRLSSMIPISQVLIAKGMALGPVMALMISSAGASLPEVVLLKSIFKKELVITFVASVIMMSTVLGFIFYLV